MSDGLGDRLLMFDNTRDASLELLRFRPQFSQPAFERALRERVQRLASFEHPAFSRVRAVERLDGDEGLTLVSTHTAGKRLSDIFRGSQPRSGMHPAFVVWLIRRVMTALTELHAQGDGIAHGALAADRIVLTPEGRLVIVEHVLGAALEELRLPANHLWRDVGVIASPAHYGSPRLDGRSDIVQLGLTALSVLLGRRVTPEEYPLRLDVLLDEFSARGGRRAPALVAPLRLWLTRALQLQDGAFGSALEANDGLRELPDPAAPPAFDHLHTPHSRAIRSSSSETSMSNTPIQTPSATPVRDLDLGTGWPQTLPEVTAIEPELPALLFREEPAPAPRAMSETPLQKPSPRPDYLRFFTARNLAAAFIGVSVLEGAIIGRLVTARSSAPVSVANVSTSAPSVPVTIDSPEAGDVVMVDGRQAGVTPLALTVNPSMHSIRVLSRSEPQTTAVSSKSAEARGAGNNAAAGGVLAAARSLAGGIRLSSPVELQVLEGERVLGSSASGPIVISAGTHRLDFINSALGYRSQQTVQIKAGQIVPLRVQPPDGRVSVNAVPWAQVWIDGNPVGETPLANVPVAVGEHEIIFRHPQYGERREKMLVKSDALTRVSAKLNP